LASPPRGPKVTILATSAAERMAALSAFLPQGWSVSEGTEALGAADYLVVRDAVVDDTLLEEARRLRRLIWLAGGDGRVDEEACARRGVRVDIVDSSTTISVAEHAVTAMLLLVKRVMQASELLRAGRIVDGIPPKPTSQTSYAFNWVGLPQWGTLRGKRVGLIGLGKIGAHVARRLRCFGADVAYTKPTRLDAHHEEELGIRYMSFEGLLGSSQCVSLHNRHTPETERMMGAREFGSMPPGSFFVNTARGGLVDEEALVDALASGHLAGAALDVFRVEPLPPDSPLLGAPNLLLTPHVGGIPVAEAETAALEHTASLMVADLGR
jgi:phosphoglycerate dehydrogenase-like enzyme